MRFVISLTLCVIFCLAVSLPAQDPAPAPTLGKVGPYVGADFGITEGLFRHLRLAGVQVKDLPTQPLAFGPSLPPLEGWEAPPRSLSDYIPTVIALEDGVFILPAAQAPPNPAESSFFSINTPEDEVIDWKINY